eukprot:gene19061-biopygen927
MPSRPLRPLQPLRPPRGLQGPLEAHWGMRSPCARVCQHYQHRPRRSLLFPNRKQSVAITFFPGVARYCRPPCIPIGITSPAADRDLGQLGLESNSLQGRGPVLFADCGNGGLS